MLVRAFQHYPNEAAIVGRLLAGYGEVEYDFALCAAATMSDLDTAMRVIFRMRNEGQRIDLIDALVRHKCDEARLSAQYADALGAVRHCKNIRNQYSHCHWAYDDGGLWFTNMEEGAKGAGKPSLHIRRVTRTLLEEQEAYFEYATECLRFLVYELEVLVGTEKTNPYSMPAKRSQPNLHNPS